MTAYKTENTAIGKAPGLGKQGKPTGPAGYGETFDVTVEQLIGQVTIGDTDKHVVAVAFDFIVEELISKSVGRSKFRFDTGGYVYEIDVKVS